MLKPSRLVLIGTAVLMCAASAATAQTARAADCGPTTPVGIVGIDGPKVHRTTYGAITTVAGPGSPEEYVLVYFRREFTTQFVPQRNAVQVGCNGRWSTTYVADADYGVKAHTLGEYTPEIIIQIAPTISGPSASQVAKGSTYTIKGTGAPGKTVTVHFHKAGTAANDYSIERQVTVDKDGRWTRPYIASVDYRFYATLPNGQRSSTVLVQAR